MTVESLARALHEAGREAVLANKVHKKDGAPVGAIKFAEWDEISEDAREGRRIQIRQLLGVYYILPRRFVYNVVDDHVEYLIDDIQRIFLETGVMK